MDFRRYWLKLLIEERDSEVLEQQTHPIEMIQDESRIALWNLCNHFDFSGHGLPGLTCKLLEKYLSIVHRENKARMTNLELCRAKLVLMLELPLLMAACFLLAAKTHSNRSIDINKYIRKKLHTKGIIVDKNKLNGYEFTVFSKLGFQIPTWTNVEAANFLAVEAGFSSNNLELLQEVVNFIEYNRNRIEKKLLVSFKKLRLESDLNFVPTLNLLGAAVPETAHLLNIVDPKITERVSNLIKIPLRHLNLIIRTIDDVINTEIDSKTVIKGIKRKLT